MRVGVARQIVLRVGDVLGEQPFHNIDWRPPSTGTMAPVMKLVLRPSFAALDWSFHNPCPQLLECQFQKISSERDDHGYGPTRRESASVRPAAGLINCVNAPITAARRTVADARHRAIAVGYSGLLNPHNPSRSGMSTPESVTLG